MGTEIGRFVVLGCVVVAQAGCGYALAGRGNALPASIQTIGVPPFINQSTTTTADLDRIFTEAVRQEFQTKGKYRVEPEGEGVDGLLTVTITNVAQQPSAFTADRQISSYSVVVTANVEFKDVKADNVIWSNPSFRVIDEYQVEATTSAVTDTAELFSRVENAQDRLAKKFAREVVTSIFEAF